MIERFPPTLAEAHARIDAVQPQAYARTRNHLHGAVSALSPYLTHGFVTVPEVFARVAARHPLTTSHKFAFELGWREYFRHVWSHRGDGILASLHEGPMPESRYARALPEDLRAAATGVPAIDAAVRTLYRTGWLHNHARMWLASYLVHLRHVHWRSGADWLYGHLLDGDLASNHLSWQWVAGTGSRQPYLFNADNVARFASPEWHSPGTVIDTSYDALARIARTPASAVATSPRPEGAPVVEPACLATPPGDIALTPPRAAEVADREVWLVHPWNLGPRPADLPADAAVIGIFVADFHRAWPWSEARWRFVARRLADLSAHCWHGEAAAIGRALGAARRVRSRHDPHLARWLPTWATLEPTPTLFDAVPVRCDSFSRWWSRVSRGQRRVDRATH